MYRYCFFFFNDPATTEIYTLSLHDALPICKEYRFRRRQQLESFFQRHDAFALFVNARLIGLICEQKFGDEIVAKLRDRKSTRLNSSHSSISYALFCLKNKKDLLTGEMSLLS